MSDKPVEEKKKLSKKAKILISVACVCLAAGIGAGLFFGLRSKPADNPVSVSDGEELNYELVDYNGGKVCECFLSFLQQADKDSAKNCKDKGIAMTINGRDISFAEFTAEYIDSFANLEYETKSMTEEYGYSKTGYDIKIIPSKQTRKSSGALWSDELKDKAVSNLTKRFTVFGEAIRSGAEFSQEDYQAIYASVRDTLSYGENNEEKSLEQIVTEKYCQGYTSSMIAAGLIMDGYVQIYEGYLKDMDQKNCPDEEFDRIKKEYPDLCKECFVHFVPLEVTFDEESYKKVKDEKTFLEFVNKSFAPFYGEDFDIGNTALCYGYPCLALIDDFGIEPLEWIVADERKAGDFTVIETDEMKYAVYMIKPCEELKGFSFKSVLVSYDYGLGEETTMITAQEYYDLWEEQGADEKSLEKLCDSISKDKVCYGAYEDLIEDCHFAMVGKELGEWATDSSRKKGDHTLVACPDGVRLVWFVSHEDDNPDWKWAASLDYSETHSKETIDSIVSSAENTINDKITTQCVESGEKRAQVIVDQVIDYYNSLEERNTDQ